MKQLAAWYQKKISSYDKEEWETLVERLLMRGTYRRRVVDFSAQARSYLIDVDLVRGSSFPKAKPTLAWRRVAWFGLVRLVFLPVLTQWWAQQTSPACARLLLALWTLEVVNIGLYCAAPKSLAIDARGWLVPLALMAALCTVHAQIVSTTELELARVRPRPVARRRPTSQAECRKPRPTKLRRRSRPDAADAAVRKRKKDPSKDAANTASPAVAAAATSSKAKVSDDSDYLATCSKAKVSDDSDYLADLDAPPAPCPAPPAPAPHYLTKKRLERFNARLSAGCADDDGFESLNGSDADNKARLNKMAAAASPANDKIEEEAPQRAESEPTSSPGRGKRAGVRFRGTWGQDAGEPDSSDEFSRTPKKQKSVVSTESSSDGERSASAPSIALPSHHTMSDWVGQTTNSEESSYCSQSDEAADAAFRCGADSSLDPFAILNPTSDTVKCTMWERGDMLRCELSAVDISWCVVARAERALAADGGGLTAAALAATAALLPPACRLLQTAIEQDGRGEEEVSALSAAAYVGSVLARHAAAAPLAVLSAAFGNNFWEVSTNVLSSVLRFALSGLVFFLLSVAERAYKQRFLYAKLFSHLTSARRARKSELPHFRLNTVRNIKTWLSARSYLRRRGPQRSVDVIVSSAFLLTLLMLAAVAAHLLRMDSVTLDAFWLLEATVWSCSLGVYLLRLLTLGGNVNRKYRGCLSAILTEQINLHLAIEQRPDCKEQLTLANNVLKLAADLLKELDSPFKISGICANHYLYTITKVVILSALSGVLSEMLGFKLKLHKIKIK